MLNVEIISPSASRSSSNIKIQTELELYYHLLK